MREKIRMAAGFISAPFRKFGNMLKKPVVAFFEKHKEGIEKLVTVLNKYSLVFHALWAMMLEFMIESFSRHSIGAGILFLTEKPIVFFYNALLIFMTFMIVYLFRRRFFIRQKTHDCR